MAAMGSQACLRALKRSPELMHMVPSLPPTQYSIPPSAATPHEDLRDDMEGTGSQRPARGSSRSTVAW